MRLRLRLLSNVFKERQPVKSTDNTSHISSSPSMTCAALSFSCGPDLYSNSQNSTLCCSNLHEELERMRLCQISAAASRQEDRRVVSPIMLELWLGSRCYSAWLLVEHTVFTFQLAAFTQYSLGLSLLWKWRLISCHCLKLSFKEIRVKIFKSPLRSHQ